MVVSTSPWRMRAGASALEPQATATDAVVATNVIHHDAAHPSHLLVPVVPRPDAPGLSFSQ